VIQAAATYCKKAKGIELMKERHAVAVILTSEFTTAKNALRIQDTKELEGRVQFVVGDLKDPNHR
tara:strand:- start:605 stop:799 length:195 start_codon:yes stop_codon:yes gene_type:complete